MFKELSKEKVYDVETNLRKGWDENKVFLKSIEQREGKPSFVFYDGPATANGNP